jgi:hypothetical protein
MARTIQSPGVEINEIDLTLRPVTVEGTSVFVAGFAAQGPIDEVLQPTSVSEFELIYGSPTNAAERYFYHTVRNVINSSPSNLLVSRLPYGNEKGDGFSTWRYSALVYPVKAVNTVYDPFIDDFVTTDESLSAANSYFIGKPSHLELSSEEYQNIINGNIDWVNETSRSSFDKDTLGESAFIILNKSQTTVNNKFEGYYIGLADNNNFNPATPFNSVLKVEGIQSSSNFINSYITVPSTRLSFSLSATKFGDGASISEVMENLSQFDLAEKTFQDTISLGLFKLRQSVFTPDTISLDYVLSESYTGSLDYHRQVGDQNGGSPRSFYLGGLTEDSANINLIVNPYLSNRFQNTWLDDNGVPSKKIRFLTKQLESPFSDQGYYDTNSTYITRVGAASGDVSQYAVSYGYADALFPVGIYSNTVTVDKTIGALPKKLDRALELVENADLYSIDVALEGGLGTIYVNAVEQSGASTEAEYLSAGEFVDSKPLNALSAFYTTNLENLSDEGLRIRGNYTAVANIFVNYAEKVRKDFLVVLDPIRNIFVQGQNAKTLNAKKIWGPNAGADPDPTADGYVAANFSQHIYWPLRHQFSTINCSYATTYATWAQVLDPNTNRQVWVPFSGIACAAMANTDANFQPWFAPAGFTRGVVTGVNDLAIYPKQKQRDQLYKISLNPVAFFPNEGFVIFGQKTLLKKPSAFDRINVRRLFLNLEKATKQTAKFFVFEPNTLFTRTQVINVLSPIFENAKNTEGLYDYRIICSELNNTPEVIDNNELKIDIYIQPVRTAEFILVNFYATRTGTNFDELIGA